MKTVGINSEYQDQIFQMLAGILHLGNVEFRPAGSDKAQIADRGGKFLFYYQIRNHFKPLKFIFFSKILNFIEKNFLIYLFNFSPAYSVVLAMAARLLCVTDQQLEQVLLSRHLSSASTRGSTYQVPLTVEQVSH